MHEGVLLKSSIAQFWTELKTVTSLLWWEPSSIKSRWKCGSCSSAERAATWSEAERGQESANSALAAFRKQQPRVHRIVMDYVQGLKSGSRAKNELTTSWRKGRSWKWVPRDTNSSNKLDLIVGGSSSVGEHHVTTPAMPWWSRLSHSPPPPASPLLNRGAAAHRTKYEWKGQVAFSPLCVPKVVPCRCDRYERQGCIFVSRHYEFKISQTLLLLRISQTPKFWLTQW